MLESIRHAFLRWLNVPDDQGHEVRELYREGEEQRRGEREEADMRRLKEKKSAAERLCSAEEGRGLTAEELMGELLGEGWDDAGEE